jgi:hypothetical protein
LLIEHINTKIDTFCFSLLNVHLSFLGNGTSIFLWEPTSLHLEVASGEEGLASQSISVGHSDWFRDEKQQQAKSMKLSPGTLKGAIASGTPSFLVRC